MARDGVGELLALGLVSGEQTSSSTGMLECRATGWTGSWRIGDSHDGIRGV